MGWQCVDRPHAAIWDEVSIGMVHTEGRSGDYLDDYVVLGPLYRFRYLCSISGHVGAGVYL